MKNVLLFLTHTWSAGIEAEFRSLSVIDDTETWILSDSRNRHLSGLVERYQRCRVFDLPSLLSLPYCRLGPESLCGNAHLPLLEFFQASPEFENYWIVEYDVRYTGDWNRLFQRFGKYPQDFVTSHIRSWNDEPHWCGWDSFGHAELPLSSADYWRSFNVIYRISAAALRFLDRELRTGWHGHHEVLLISLLLRGGFKVLDFGGDGAFAPPAMRNRVYRSSSTKDGSLNNRKDTLRYRPIGKEPGPLRNKLYHPIKPDDDPGGFAAFGYIEDGW